MSLQMQIGVLESVFRLMVTSFWVFHARLLSHRKPSWRMMMMKFYDPASACPYEIAWKCHLLLFLTRASHSSNCMFNCTLQFPPYDNGDSRSYSDNYLSLAYMMVTFFNVQRNKINDIWSPPAGRSSSSTQTKVISVFTLLFLFFRYVFWTHEINMRCRCSLAHTIACHLLVDFTRWQFSSITKS